MSDFFSGKKTGWVLVVISVGLTPEALEEGLGVLRDAVDEVTGD